MLLSSSSAVLCTCHFSSRRIAASWHKCWALFGHPRLFPCPCSCALASNYLLPSHLWWVLRAERIANKTTALAYLTWSIWEHFNISWTPVLQVVSQLASSAWTKVTECFRTNNNHCIQKNNNHLLSSFLLLPTVWRYWASFPNLPSFLA